MHFHQTCVNDALWDRDECLTVWGQKVKSPGHDGIKRAVLTLNYAIQKIHWNTVKYSHCKLWFCALAPSSKLDTR